jgi:hypothetical protein
MAVPWSRRVVAGLSPRRRRFDLGLVYVGFVANKVALRQASRRLLQLFAVSFILLTNHVNFELNVVTKRRRGRAPVTFRSPGDLQELHHLTENGEKHIEKYPNFFSRHKVSFPETEDGTDDRTLQSRGSISTSH